MSLYPSFEALTIGKEVDAQNKFALTLMSSPAASGSVNGGVNYAALAQEFLGLDLSLVTYDEYGNACYCQQPSATPLLPYGGTSVALPNPYTVTRKDPVEVTHGVQELKVIKRNGYLGIQLRNQDRGVFVTYVESGSPAAEIGLRFGDQVLKINDQYTCGMTGKDAMKLIQKSQYETVTVVIRDRPLERVVTLTKDSNGSLGFMIKDGSIDAVVKDSSAARNGILINNQLAEVNGINVLGVSDKKIRKFITISGPSVKLTLIPGFYFEHLSKKLGKGFLKTMDRSEPLV